MTKNFDRRSFLRAAAALPFVPAPFSRGLWLPRADDRVLLVVELVGGNDGLNTVIPCDDPRYAALRPKLQVARHGARALGDGTSLHAALTNVHRHVTAGTGAVVHGVGYPHPDRSHFRSRDIWHTADPQHVRVQSDTTGWLGRVADALVGESSGVPAAAIGALEVPLLLRGARAMVPSLRRVEDFQWLSATANGSVGGDDATRRAIVAAEPAVGANDLSAQVARTTRAAVTLADDLSSSLARYRAKADYPDTALGRDLQLAARVAIAGFGVRLLHVAFSGFDTHARQLPTHAGLLGQLDAALAALLADLEAHGKKDRTVVLVHSEFGRRVQENGSQGTDHGAAAPVFAFFGGITGGVHGKPPNLDDLDDGDVKVTVDFRSVYGDVLLRTGLPVRDALGASFPSAGLAPAGIVR